MTNNPLVSIIIPLYNAENYIEDCISSLLQQTYKEIEIIIIDDGSSDSSLSIARQYESERIHVYSQKNKGACVARNFGFKMSKGEYVQFMDADDTIEDKKIELQIDRLRRFGFKSDVVAFSKWQYLENPEVHLNEQLCKDYDNPVDMLVDFILCPHWMYPHAYLVHRELVEKTGGWDEGILKNQDGEFFARIKTVASKLVYVDGTCVYYRAYTPGSLSKGLSYEKQESVLETLIRISEIISRSNNMHKDQAVKIYLLDYIGRFYPYYGNLCRKAMRYLNQKYPDEKFQYPKRSLLRWGYYYAIKFGFVKSDRIL